MADEQTPDQEKKSRSPSRNAQETHVYRSARAQLHDDNEVPDVTIKLGRTYGFNLQPGGLGAFLVDQNVVDTSSLREKHHMYFDQMMQNRVYLGERNTSPIDLPPGVTILLGRSGAGKTKLALKHLTGYNDSVMYVRHGEPLDYRFVELLSTDPASHGVALLPFESSVAHVIANFLFTPATDVLIVDSLRYLFYASGGSTGKGGVNMSLFADISYLDVVANLRGKSLVIIVNPLTDDDASYKAVVEAAKGSVSGLIDVLTPTSIRFTSRYAERDWKHVTLAQSEPITSKRKTRDALDTPNTASGGFSFNK